MARVLAHVVDAVLIAPPVEVGPVVTIPVGTASWFTWLAQGRAFAFQGSVGHFTARREARPGGRYWYAYRRQTGVLHTVYLGRDADLTLAGLERAAARLAGSPPPLRSAAYGARAADERRPTGASRRTILPHPHRATHSRHDSAFRNPPSAFQPPPLRSDLLPRPHLIARLNAAVAHPLTLVIAPAGFGKTTLLAAWAVQWPGSVACVALDARDNDPARLWGRIDAALAQLADALAATDLPAGTAAQRAQGTAPRPGVLVLDDLHEISTPGLQERVATLLDDLPPDLRLIVATRAAPPWPLARPRVVGQVAEIGPADLRFGPAEAEAFVCGALGAGAAAEVSTLAARSEGWIAGLQLLVLAAQEGAAPPTSRPPDSGDARYIHEYLAEQVFDRLAADVQHFLLATAILDRLSGPLCEAVTGKPGGNAQLAALAAANLFLTPLDATRQWYRYHALFAEFLRERLARTTPDLRPALHRRAAAWYADQGQPAEAVPHALTAGDFATAATLISVSAPVLVQRGELTTILSWLAVLPAALVEERPDLSIWYAWMLLLTGKLVGVEPRLQAAERRLQEPATNARATIQSFALGQIQVIRASLARARGEAGPTIAFVQQAQALFAQAAGADRTMQSLIWLNLGQAHLLQGNLAAAEPALTSARQISQAAEQVYTAVSAIASLAEVALAQGRLFQAEMLYRQALHLTTGPDGRLGPPAGSACVGLGALYYEWNDLDRAARYLAQGCALAERAGNDGTLLAAILGLARVQQARGDYDVATTLLAQATALADRRQVPHDRARVAAGLARLALAESNSLPAAARLQATLPDPADVAGPAGWDTEYAVLARLLLALGRITEALTLLERLHSGAVAAGDTGRRIEALVLLALTWQRQGAPTRAAAIMAEALARAAPAGYIRLLVDEGPPMRHLVRAARAAPRAYHEALRRAFAAEPAPLRPLGPPAALTAREREVLALLANGLAYQAIAQRLVVTESTARWHIKNLYRKLGVRRRSQAIHCAQERGLLA